MKDCLDAFIVGASMDLLEVENVETEPKRHQVLLDALSADDQLKYEIHSSDCKRNSGFLYQSVQW